MGTGVTAGPLRKDIQAAEERSPLALRAHKSGVRKCRGRHIFPGPGSLCPSKHGSTHVIREVWWNKKPPAAAGSGWYPRYSFPFTCPANYADRERAVTNNDIIVLWPSRYSLFLLSETNDIVSSLAKSLKRKNLDLFLGYAFENENLN